MRLDVIIPCYGQHRLLARLLGSIQKHAPDWVRMVIVDNGRGIPTLPDRPKAPPPLVIRNSENVGFIRAVNQALCASTAEYVCIQNDDTEIFGRCYEQLMHDLLEHEDVAVMAPVASAGGSAWLSVDVLQKRWAWFPQDLPDMHVDRAWHLRYADLPIEVHRPSMVPFYCALMARETVDRIGLLDTRYGVGLGDDDDYCLRIRNAGLECGLSLRTYVYHRGRATFDANYTPEEMSVKCDEAAELVRAKWEEQ